MTWSPAHGAHAIERVVAQVKFKEKIPGRLLKAIIDRHVPRVRELGLVRTKNASITIGAAMPQIQFPDRAGIEIGRFDGPRLLEEASFLEDRFQYTTGEYTSWSTLLERFSAIFAAALDDVFTIVEPEFAKLEYWDLFLWNDDDVDPKYGELLSEKSLFLPRFWGELDQSLFHCHVGRFKQSKLDTVKRMLVALNVDAIELAAVPLTISDQVHEAVSKPEQGLRNGVGIYSSGQSEFEKDHSPDKATQIQAVFDEAKRELNFCIADLLTDNAKASVGLSNSGEIPNG